MSDEMKNRYVEYLIERLENAELDNRAMKLVLDEEDLRGVRNRYPAPTGCWKN